MTKKTKELTNLKEQDLITSKKATSVVSSATKSKKSSRSIVSNKSKTKKSSAKKSNISNNDIFSHEYYDLPLKYNKTIVKILAQTPKKLFIYWEISDSDKNIFMETYGDNFFDITYPILKIYNKTNNYNFEVKIDDFANSWYLDIEDEKCEYSIELCRRFKLNSDNNCTDCLNIVSSNIIESPNGHILFDESNETVYFKNTKTNEIHSNNIANLNFIKRIGKVYKIYNLYKQIYKSDEILNLNNPSLNNPTSIFK